MTGRPALSARLLAGLHTRVLERLPGRVARRGQAVLRGGTLRAIARGPAPTLLVTHDLSRSGAPRLVLEIARILRDARHRPVILSPVSGPLLVDLVHDGFHVIVSPALARARWMDELATRARFAVCNTVATREEVRRLASTLPVLWYVHEVSLLQQLLKEVATEDALKRAAVVWAGSPMCADILKTRRDDARVVPYGLAPLASALPPAGERLSVGVFGSIERRKGQDLAVAALAALPPADRAAIDLTLYGRVLEPDFAAAVFAAGEVIGVRHAGELDRAGYEQAMRGVDAVLVPSRDDTLPLVSIDALGLGRLLLLSSGVGTSAWLKDDANALIADAADAPSLTRLLQRALAVREVGRVEAIGAAAKTAFATHFSFEAFRQRVTAVASELEARR